MRRNDDGFRTVVCHLRPKSTQPVERHIFLLFYRSFLLTLENSFKVLLFQYLFKKKNSKNKKNQTNTVWSISTDMFSTLPALTMSKFEIFTRVMFHSHFFLVNFTATTNVGSNNNNKISILSFYKLGNSITIWATQKPFTLMSKVSLNVLTLKYSIKHTNLSLNVPI